MIPFQTQKSKNSSTSLLCVYFKQQIKYKIENKKYHMVTSVNLKTLLMNAYFFHLFSTKDDRDYNPKQSSGTVIVDCNPRQSTDTVHVDYNPRPS
jgi:hypothetical protein